MRPQDRPLSWTEFIDRWGPYSIAIDGYVADKPALDSRLPVANLNHHENVSRLETRASCAQALLEIRVGLFKVFRKGNDLEARVFANDCDEDVCLTYYLLSHSWIAESVINPRLNKLVSLVDLLDTCSGMYPLPIDMPILSELAWVFEPYRRFRMSGGLEKRDPAAFTDVVTNVCNRIEKFIVGENGVIPLDARYNVLKRGTGWAMIEEIGPYGRQGALADGIHAFVSAKERADGRWSYSVCRISELIAFPVPEILIACDEEEKNPSDHWGGGTTTGGSGRNHGSRQNPDHVFGTVESEVLHFKEEGIENLV
ncbi:MAG: Uncharacterized protein G01um101420_934 [Parcubacteria group bacterium Gr01-1014_20]|nr:MAG: Uncharacterized protein G01um101420_934 [Parcubacteria group bacterium Gr01-1014_20]